MRFQLRELRSSPEGCCLGHLRDLEPLESKQPGWEKKSGRYLIVQISDGNHGMILNLRQVLATGNPCSGSGNDYDY